MDDATAGELRRPGRALAGAAGALLLVGLLATAADLAATLGGVGALTRSGLPERLELDGEDRSDVWLGASRPRAKDLFWERRYENHGHPVDRSPMLAVRSGAWKLLMNPDRSRVELYDVVRDPSELRELSAAHPDVVERLAPALLAWSAALPAGKVLPDAGANDYPWPSSTR